jgi:hypothetical protein
MLKSLTNRCLFAVVFALITSAVGCTVQERKVELQGSTPALPTPQAPERRPTIAASQVEEGAEGWKVTAADFVVRVSDIRRGRALTAGRTEPLVDSAAKGRKKGRAEG